ncbi:uncharacterized protein LOC130668127 [Microplitis mediator]|uniref:uncharacterized protein LOC130668127 n=1 Tax=Microplitis mediator TaxID=375433 RepID=UPI002553DE46|nr:uncharacterized protein LOC130668127 [Microplitis mediator]
MINNIKKFILIAAALLTSSRAIDFSHLDPTQGRFFYECSPTSVKFHFSPNTSMYAASIVVDHEIYGCWNYYKVDVPPPPLEVKFSDCTLGRKQFDIILADYGVCDCEKVYYQEEIDCVSKSDEVFQEDDPIPDDSAHEDYPLRPLYISGEEEVDVPITHVIDVGDKISLEE